MAESFSGREPRVYSDDRPLQFALALNSTVCQNIATSISLNTYQTLTESEAAFRHRSYHSEFFKRLAMTGLDLSHR